MSFFKIPCPGCNKSLKVPESLAGKSRVCPYCRATVRVPDSVPAEPDPVFPGIQVADSSGAAKSRSRPAVGSVAPAMPPSAAIGPNLQTTAAVDVTAAAPVTAKKGVHLRKRQKSWFRSSSESASSDTFLINRVIRGIEHFRVRKSAAETVTMMESQSAIDANNLAGSYTIIRSGKVHSAVRKTHRPRRLL